MLNKISIRPSYLIYFLLFNISFVSLVYLPFYNILKYIIIVICLLFIILNYKYIFRKKFIFFELASILYILVLMYSSFINRGTTERNTFFAGTVFSLTFMCTIFITEISYNRKEEKVFFNIIYKTLFLYTITSDFILLLFPNLVNLYDSYYLIGNKFSMSYYHLVLLFFFVLRNKRFDYICIIKLIFLFCFSIFIINKVDCRTGLIGCLLFLLFLFFNRFLKIKIGVTTISFAMILSFLFVFLYKQILEIKIVENLITFFDRSITLTGRTIIYEAVPEIIYRKIKFGYGYGSSYDVLQNLIGAPNCQNALLEILFMSGVIGSIFFIMMIICMASNYKKSNNAFILYLMLTVILLGTIETTYGGIFLSLIPIINTLKFSNYKNNY